MHHASPSPARRVARHLLSGAWTTGIFRHLVILGIAITTACDGAKSPRITAPPEAVASSAQLDPEIDQSDSWAAADVSISGSEDVTSDEPYLDPETGATVTQSTQSASSGITGFQVGFNSSGQTVAVSHHAPDVGDPANPDSAAVAVTKIVGGVATDYDAQGRVVPETPIDTLEGPSPINEMPVAQGQVMIDAMVKPQEDGGGDPGGDTCPDCEIGVRGSLTSSGAKGGGLATRVLVRNARTLVLESAFSAGTELTFASAVRASGHEASGARRVRRGYSRRAGHWVIDSLTIEEHASPDGRGRAKRTQMRFRNVRFHLDHDRNRARRDALVRAAIEDARALLATPRLALLRAPAARASVLELPAPATAASSTTCSDRSGPVGTTGPSVVFQHGYFSNPCSWDRMERWVLPAHQFSTRVAIQTPFVRTYDEQAAVLRDAMERTGSDDWVLIGHSNGGIVSRRAAQSIQNDATSPLYIRGVLTIGSPHRGAPAMNHFLPAVRAFFQAVAAYHKWSLCPGYKRGCTDMRAATDGVVQQIYELQRDGPFGVSQQMTTNSSFRTELESRSEPFVRASIVSHSYPKYQWKRMYGDFSCNPEAECGGREGVRRTERLIKHLKKMTILNGLAAVGSALLGQAVPASYFSKNFVSKGGQLLALQLIEKGYNMWVRGDPDSDGIVPGWSQVYPRTDVLQQFHIDNADSHVGSTKSELVRREVFRALRTPSLFGVRPQ